MNDVLNNLSNQVKKNSCCLKSLKLQDSQKKYLVFLFTDPVTLKIKQQEVMWGQKVQYMSHIGSLVENGKELHYTYFRKDERILYQNFQGEIHQVNFNVHKKVKILAILLGNQPEETKSDASQNFVLKAQIQKYIQKKYLSIINPKEYEIKESIQKEKQKEWDRIRDKTEERKARDQKPERKRKHSEIYKKRDQTEERSN